MENEFVQTAPADQATEQQLLIRGCTLLSPIEPGKLLHGQDILISGKRIEALGPAGTVAYDPAREIKIIPGDHCIALPGLINAHTHSLENVLKATSPSLPLELWLVPLFSDTVSWTPRFVYLSTIIGAIEMLKTGTTAVLDHLWTASGVAQEYLDAAMQAYKDVGIRAAVAPSIEDQDLVLEAGTMQGLVFPRHPFVNRFESWPSIDEQLATLERFIVTWHNTEDGRLRCIIGPSGIHWCSPYLMQACLDLADRYTTGMHLHAVETQLQAAVIRETLGRGGIEYLHHCGMLRPGTSLAHAIWLEEGDLDILAGTQTTVVHNPVSNLRLGSGHFPLSKARRHGVTIALGSDGSASNDTQNMFGVLKMTGLMHNRPEDDYRRWPQPTEILELATTGGAAALGLREVLGRLAPGYLADIVLLDLENTAFLPLRDPYLHLVYCEHGTSVQTVIVHGDIVVERGIVCRVDEAALSQELRELCVENQAAFASNVHDNAVTRELLSKLDVLRRRILQQTSDMPKLPKKEFIYR